VAKARLTVTFETDNMSDALKLAGLLNQACGLRYEHGEKVYPKVMEEARPILQTARIFDTSTKAVRD
jgi:hypothetical protein